MAARPGLEPALEGIVKLTYRRQTWSGTYTASTDTHQFAIDKVRQEWHLRIWERPTQTTLSTMVTTDHLPTLGDAKAAAQDFADEQEN